MSSKTDFRELDSFIKMIKEMVDESEITTTTISVVKISINCSDVDNTFMVRDIKLLRQEDEETIEMTIYYNVYHFNKRDELSTVIEMSKDMEMEEMIFSIFWMYKLCPECLELIPKTKEMCGDCMFHKIRQQYGISKGMIEGYDLCMICQDEVYHTKLQCGHSIHHLCILNLNPKKWYHHELKLKCPVCRQPFTDYDKNRFFTY